MLEIQLPEYVKRSCPEETKRVIGYGVRTTPFYMEVWYGEGCNR